jgi:PAS domain S-box-containing protein/putative nucleotidyltransferase with HDIG domain
MVVSSGMEEHVEFVNAKFIELFGYTVDDMPDAGHWWPLAYPDEEYREEIKTLWRTRSERAIREQGEIEPVEAMVSCKDGSHRYVEFRLSSIGEKHLVTFVDLTERKQAEEALAARELELRNLADSSPGLMGTFYLRPDGSACMPYASPQIQNLFGLRPEDVVDDATPLLARTHPDDANRVNESIAESARTMTPWHLEYRVIHPTRGELWLEGSTNPRPHPDGGVIWYGFVHDITDRKRAEEELQKTNDLLRAIIEAAPTAIIGLDLEGKVQNVWNPVAEKMLGWSAQEVMGRFLPTVSVDKEEEFRQFRDWIRSGKTLNGVEVTRQRRDGTPIDYSIYASPLHSPEGQIVGNIAVLVDITERKQMTEALAAQEREFRTLAENSPDNIARYDVNCRTLYVNPALEKTLGRPASEILGTPPMEMKEALIYETRKYQEKIAEVLETGKVDEMDLVLPDRGEGVRYHNIRFVAERGADGAITGVQTIGRDITELKRTEAQIERALRETQTRFEISQALAGAETEDEVLDVLIQHAGLYPQAFVAIFTFDRTGGELIAILRRQDTFESGLTAAMFIGEGLPASRYTLFSHFFADQPFVSENVGADERFEPAGRATLEQMGAASFAAVPLTSGNEWMGYIGVMAKPSGYFDEEKQHLYQTLAEQGAVVLRAARLRETIRESQQRLSLFVQQSPLAVIEWDMDFQVVSWNPAAEQMFGYTRQEALGRYADLIVSEAARPAVDQLWQDLLEQKGSTYNISENLTRDGHIITCEWFNAPLVGAGGQTIGVASLVRDITERKKAEQALRESEERLRQIASSLREVIWLRDAQTRQVLYVNSAFEEVTGRTCESFYENRDIVIDAIHPDDKEGVIKALEQRFESVPFNKEHRIIHLDGSVRWVSSRIFPVRNEAGEVYRWASIMEDITERKQHERERESVIAVSTALRRAKTRTEILNVILDQLIDLFDADGAVLVLPDPQTGGFIDEMGRGIIGERMIGLNIPPGKGVCNWVITNKKPYLTNHADRDALFYRPDLLGDAHCLACVPLIAHEHALGALWVARQIDFVEQDLRLLNAIADIAANAIHRVMLHEQTELQLRHLTALHQIDLAISANFDLNITFKVILSNVKDELEVDAVSILLLDPVTHTLDYAAGIGFRTSNIEQSHVKLGKGCAGLAAQECRTVYFSDLRQAGESFSRASFLTDEEFISHYDTPLVVKGQVKGVLEIFHRAVIEPEPGWLSYFEILATQAAIAIENASLFENLQQSNMELVLAYDATIEGWSRALDLRDRETEGHTQRVAEMALELAEKMGMSNAEKLDLRRGALLHDIGKMGVPDAILLKPGRLSKSEWKIMRQHPLYAYQMLSPITYLKHALEVPYYHHEKWDGSGYPRGLMGDGIPLSARVFAVVDVFDALISDRPYSKAWPVEEAYRYIREQAGKYFDPQVVKVFLEGR